MVAIRFPDVFILKVMPDGANKTCSNASYCAAVILSAPAFVVVTCKSLPIPVNPYTSARPVIFVPSPVKEPLKLFAVTIPATTIPSTLVVIVPTPAVCVILLTLIQLQFHQQ